jgi:hypothetical protein
MSKFRYMPLKRPFFIILLLFFAFLAAVIVIHSCRGQKDEDLYIGAWQYTATVTADDMVYITTRTMVFTKNSYEETYVIQRQNSGTISGIIGTRGNLRRTRDNFLFELKELGTCARDAIDGCTNEVLWYGEASQYWIDNVEFYGLIIKGNMRVTETTLLLTRDLNNDGDTEDEGENVEFQRI